MSVFHRINDISAMPGRAFFRLAHRLTAYRGVMRERALARQAQEDDHAAPAQSRDWPAPQSAGERREVPATKAVLQSDPVFSGLISFA